MVKQKAELEKKLTDKKIKLIEMQKNKKERSRREHIKFLIGGIIVKHYPQFSELSNDKEIENENEYLLPDMLSLIGTESDSAKRVREYRERQKNKPINFENQKTLHCNAKVTKCNKNVTPDIDIDKDIRSLPLTPSKEGEEKNERDFFIKIKNIKTFKTYNNNKLLEHLAENYKELALEEAEKIDKKEREKFDDEPKIKDPGAYLLTMLKNIKK